MSDHHTHHSGCSDWYSTRRAALARAVDQIVPIPDEALTEGPEAAAKIFAGGVTRRQALAGAGGLALATALMPKFGGREIFEAAQAQAAGNPAANILVLIYLDGGNDGLNTLIPWNDPQYHTKRSRIGIADGAGLPLGGPAPDANFHWHPALTGLRDLYDAGKVAVLPSVDYTPTDQSHFNSQIYWRTGIVGQSYERSGWLGRTIDRIGVTNNPLQAVSVGWGLDPVLLSRSKPVATVFDPADFAMYIPGVWDPKEGLSPYRGMVSGARTRARRSAQGAMRNAISVYDRLGGLRAAPRLPEDPTPYSNDYLGKGLRNVARMLGAGLGTRIVTVSHSGFDTHINQTSTHPELLTSLGNSLKAFQDDLTAKGLSDHVMTMVWSEFGRRVEDNDSNGTDHGAGGLMLLVGDHARAGIRTEFPGLSVLDGNDNLRVTTQFRTVYATILEDWLGVPAGAILPRITSTRLPLFV